jgi:regulator of protease activity HflC (stomatin/prohibitin superfamily)
LEEYGYQVANLLIYEIDPGEEMRSSFNKVRASKLLESAAEGEANANLKLIVGEAKAKKESIKLSAEGYAEARKSLIEFLINAKKELDKGKISLELFVKPMQSVDGFDAAREGGGIVVMNTGGSDNTGIIAAIAKQIVKEKSV